MTIFLRKNSVITFWIANYNLSRIKEVVVLAIFRKSISQWNKRNVDNITMETYSNCAILLLSNLF
jgi:hypothetical protein